MTSDELRTAGANLREFVEMRGGKWDASMFDALGREVLHLSEAEFYAALQRCKAELRYPPLPVDITESRFANGKKPLSPEKLARLAVALDG